MPSKVYVLLFAVVIVLVILTISLYYLIGAQRNSLSTTTITNNSTSKISAPNSINTTPPSRTVVGKGIGSYYSVTCNVPQGTNLGGCVSANLGINGTISFEFAQIYNVDLYNPEIACGYPNPPTQNTTSGYVWLTGSVEPSFPYNALESGGFINGKLPCYLDNISLSQYTPTTSFKENIWLRFSRNTSLNKTITIPLLNIAAKHINYSLGSNVFTMTITPDPVEYAQTFNVVAIPTNPTDNINIFFYSSTYCNPGVCALTYHNGTIISGGASIAPGNYTVDAVDAQANISVKLNLTVLPANVLKAIQIPKNTIVTASSPQNMSTNKSLGLSLIMLLNTTNATTGANLHDAIQVTLGVKNLLGIENNVSLENNFFTINGVYGGPNCMDFLKPVLMAIYKGNETINQLANANVLQLYPPQANWDCNGAMVPAFNFYGFLPDSYNATFIGRFDNQTYYYGGLWNANQSEKMQISFQQNGYWLGSAPLNSIFQNFTIGNYTILGEDEWGQVVLIHFSIK